MRGHLSENPQRNNFIDDIGQLLGLGHTLLAKDVAEIAPRYGYSKNSARCSILENPYTRKRMATNGVALVVEKYRGRRIFTDGNLDPADTDIAESKRQIDGDISTLILISSPTVHEQTSKEKLHQLIEMLERHASLALTEEPPNFMYAQAVSANVQRLKRLVEAREGSLNGLVITWMDDLQPIAEHIFGTSLAGQPVKNHKEFQPTIFKGIYGRTRILSADEVNGPTVSLDLAALPAHQQ